MKKFILLLVLMLFATASFASADVAQLSRQTVTSCSGTGELLLYNGDDPFVGAEEDVDFSTDYNQMLIFTRHKYYEWLKVKLDNVPATLDEYWKDGVVLSDVIVYSVDTTPGSDVDFEAKVYNNGTRGIQAFLLQDSNAPFFNDGFNVLWDDEATDTTYFYPGSYNYVFFDKYSYNKYPEFLNNQPDNRPLTITVKDSDSNVVYSHTFTHPSPSGTQGVVIADFDIDEEGWYDISVATEDSVYWAVIPCEPREVPEFGVITAAIALIGTLGVFVFIRRKE